MAQIRSTTVAEIAQAVEAAAESRARLEAHAPQILGDLALSRVYALLGHRHQADAEAGPMVNGG